MLAVLAIALSEVRFHDKLKICTMPTFLIIDDVGMCKRPHTATENLLELTMHRYERASTMLTSNRPVDDWGKLLGDTAAVSALLSPHVVCHQPRSAAAVG